MLNASHDIQQAAIKRQVLYFDWKIMNWRISKAVATKEKYCTDSFDAL